MIYLELLDIEWDEGGLEPSWLVSPYSFLCGSIGCHWRTFKEAWKVLAAKFDVQVGGKIGSRRGQDEIKIASELSQDRAKAAKKRWDGNATAMLTQSQSQSQSQEEPPTPESPKPLTLVPFVPVKPKPKKTGATDRPDVLEVLAELNRQRSIAIPGSRPLEPVKSNTSLIADRLDEGNSVEACLHVIAVCAEETRADADVGKWFNAVTPFRPDNFARKVARTVKTNGVVATKRDGYRVLE
jgi:hypothetical protein